MVNTIRYRNKTRQNIRIKETQRVEEKKINDMKERENMKKKIRDM